jgi:hypothetical protein
MGETLPFARVLVYTLPKCSRRRSRFESWGPPPALLHGTARVSCRRAPAPRHSRDRIRPRRRALVRACSVRPVRLRQFDQPRLFRVGWFGGGRPPSTRPGPR